MKRGIILFLAFILIVSSLSVLAEIASDNINEEYLWGEEIKPIVIIEPEVEAKALFSAEIICEEFDRVYYVQPVDLIPGDEIKINVPGFEAFNKTNGSCIIDFYLDSIIGARIEKSWTEEFTVTDEKVMVQEENEIIKKDVDEEEAVIEEDIVEEEEESDNDATENKSKNGFYVFILLVLMIISLYVYFKLKLMNKNKFNRGWKI